MQELGGRTFLVTGANTGIGKATAEGLAARGAAVYVAARSRDKGEAAVAAIRAAAGSDSVSFLALDLADLESVRACAEAFLARGELVFTSIPSAAMVTQEGIRVFAPFTSTRHTRQLPMACTLLR